MIGSSPISWLAITELDSAAIVDNNPEARLWLFDEPWEAPDEYQSSIGDIVNLIDAAAAVVDDPNTRIAVWEDEPDLVVDAAFKLDDFTEPIYDSMEGINVISSEFEHQDEFDLTEIPQLFDDSLEGITWVVEEFDQVTEFDEGVIPQLVEDVAAPVDDSETRIAIWDDGSDEPIDHPLDIDAPVEDSLEGISSQIDEFEQVTEFEPELWQGYTAEVNDDPECRPSPDDGDFQETEFDEGYLSIQVEDAGTIVDNNLEVRLWLYEEDWQPDDEYQASIGDIGNLTDEADATVPSSAPDYSVKKTKKRHIVKIDGHLLEFSKESDAINAVKALSNQEKAKHYPVKRGNIDANVPEPENTFALRAIEQLAQQYSKETEYRALIQRKQYETLLMLYQQLQQREQDDEEILLLAAYD